MDLQAAIEDLYRIAVVDEKSTSTKRLSALASCCVDQLSNRGLRGAEVETTIDGGGRPKAWDVAWPWMHKYRLVLSLKSILKNLSGTVPNRIDDLMGETANIQLYSPEVVTGYVMVFDVAGGSSRAQGDQWYQTLKERLDRLAVRRAPYWTPSTFECYSLLKVDFSKGPVLVAGEKEFGAMFDRLVEEAHLRNPGIKLEERADA